MKAYDKLHDEIYDVAIINYVERTCFLRDRRIQGEIGRDFEDVIFLEETGKKDRHGNELIEDDFIKNLNGTIMQIKYGEYKMFCPSDKMYENNVGFYVEAKGYPQMPLGPTEDYAIKLGNIYTDRKLCL